MQKLCPMSQPAHSAGHMEDGHERISLVIWTSPAEDLKSGLCSWYLAEALQV